VLLPSPAELAVRRLVTDEYPANAGRLSATTHLAEWYRIVDGYRPDGPYSAGIGGRPRQVEAGEQAPYYILEDRAPGLRRPCIRWHRASGPVVVKGGEHHATA
jgi:hypothetical protein